MVGYTEAAVSVLESDGVAQLTIAISVPDTSITFGSFSLAACEHIQWDDNRLVESTHKQRLFTLLQLSTCIEQFCAPGVCHFIIYTQN